MPDVPAEPPLPHLPVGLLSASAPPANTSWPSQRITQPLLLTFLSRPLNSQLNPWWRRRVKNIQDEYQKYMERVRAKAQSAIDQANTAYSQQRNVLMSRFDALVAFLTHHQQAVQQVRGWGGASGPGGRGLGLATGVNSGTAGDCLGLACARAGASTAVQRAGRPSDRAPCLL